jgi:GTP cyclohydrolase II
VSGTTPASIRLRVGIPLRFADGYSTEATVISFSGLLDDEQHLAIELGRPGAADVPLVRLHSECLTGDVFGSQRCDCGAQLRESVQRIAAHGGYLLYLRQEGRGIGLYDKLDAYALQDGGLDTYEANLALGHGRDERDYTGAVQMLRALEVTCVRLLSNNPDKCQQLARLGITIVQQVPTGLHLTDANAAYLAAKAYRGGHGPLSLALEQAAASRRREAALAREGCSRITGR